jgi:hypothetical protein
VEQPNSRTEMPVFFAGGDRRRGGRPRVSEEPMERIDIRIPASTYDDIIKLALSRGESVSSITRSLLITRVRREVSSVKT